MTRSQARQKLITLLSGKSLDTSADVEYVTDFLLSSGVNIFEGTVCPECNFPLTHEGSLRDFESASGLRENIYSCRECGSAWVTKIKDSLETSPERYFIG